MPQQGEIWPLKLIFVLALLGGLVIVWDPAVLSGSPKPPDRSTAFLLLALAALAAVALAFPQLLFWTKGASSGALATLNANIATLDRNVTKLDGNVTTLDPKVTSLNATLAAANFGKLATDLATVTAAIPLLQADIANLQTAIQKIDQNTAACCADLMTATTDVKKAVGNASDPSDPAATLVAGVAALKTALGDASQPAAGTVFARLKAIEEKVKPGVP